MGALVRGHYGHHLGPKNVANIQSGGMAETQEFRLSTSLNGHAVGTKVSGRYRQGVRSSGVAVKRGSTVGEGTTLSVHTCMCTYLYA